MADNGIKAGEAVEVLVSVILTFRILFQKENTEGVEQWQVTAATKEKGGKEDQE